MRRACSVTLPRPLRQLVAGLVLGAATVAPLRAQCTTAALTGTTTRTCSFSVAAPNSTSYTNPALLNLTASATSFTTSVTSAMLTAGKTTAQTMVLSVRGNRSWTVTASGPATWTGTGTLARTNKPVGDLRWSTVTTGAGTALTTSAATLHSGSAGSTNSKTIYWWTNLSYTGDPPGSYAIAVTLTLTAP
jgi:hypothetical protein